MVGHPGPPCSQRIRGVFFGFFFEDDGKNQKNKLELYVEFTVKYLLRQIIPFLLSMLLYSFKHFLPAVADCTR